MSFFRSVFAVILLSSFTSLQGHSSEESVCVIQDRTQAFDSTIPVVDLKDFQDPALKEAFVESLSKAMHEVGFFAVINTGIDQNALENAYEVSQAFFNSDMNDKTSIYKPELNGQRGYVPSEIAQGSTKKDFKEFVHIGRKDNLWPGWMDLQSPMERLMSSLDEHSEILQRAFACAIGENEDFFVNMTREGDCLLRMLHYPSTDDLNKVWAAKHTDIDLFTILPIASEEGLQLQHNGEWIDVKVPPNAFIVNVGDMLQNLSNGYFKSSVHRVVAKPHVERYSIVYFIHPRSEDSMGPTLNCIQMTGGIQRYPEATRIELLACRLREIGLASPALLQLEKDSGILERIQDLVDRGVAAEPVELTHKLKSVSY